MYKDISYFHERSNKMDKLKALLKSRKFWAAILALAFLFVDAYYPQFPFSQEQVLQFILVVISFIFGTAIEDGLRGR